MQLEFRCGGMVVRVDGDVIEIFGTTGSSHPAVPPVFTRVAGLCGRSVVA